jgi:hypothetical protein
MKKPIRLFALLLILVSGIASAAEFGYPVSGEPWYYIRVSFADTTGLSKGLWRISRVEVNGARGRDFLLYQAEKECLSRDIEGTIPFEVKVRHGWTGNESYEIRVQLENARTKKSVTLAQKATSPALKGYWDPGWRKTAPSGSIFPSMPQSACSPTISTIPMRSASSRPKNRVAMSSTRKSLLRFTMLSSGPTRKSWLSRRKTKKQAHALSVITRRPALAWLFWPTSDPKKKPPTSFSTTTRTPQGRTIRPTSKSREPASGRRSKTASISPR